MDLKQRWDTLEPRERRTLIGGAVALAIIVFVYGIWLPAQRKVEQLDEAVAQQRATLAWMQQAAAEARALQASGARSTTANTGGQALYALADQSARKAGLGSAIRRVDPSGNDKVRVTLEGASFDSMIGWLAQIQSQYGIEASLVSARLTDAPGRVNGEAVLEGAQQ